MVSPPYSLNTAAPANTDIAANFPSLDRSDKAIVQAWLSVQLDSYGQNTQLLLDQIGSARGLVSAPTTSAGNMVLYYDTDETLKQYSGDLAAIEFVGIVPGTVVDYAGASTPAGYLLCYGQAVSRTTYARLFAALSTTWGAGDGSTTFNVPDLRGRATFGLDNMGGTAAGRLSVTITGTTLGATGGLEAQTITQANLPAVNLVSSSLTATTTASPSTWTAQNNVPETSGGSAVSGIATTTPVFTTTISGTVPLGGSGTAQPVLNPAAIVNKIIKY